MPPLRQPGRHGLGQPAATPPPVSQAPAAATPMPPRVAAPACRQAPRAFRSPRWPRVYAAIQSAPLAAIAAARAFARPHAPGGQIAASNAAAAG